jgi:RHS repeat-associated protein
MAPKPYLSSVSTEAHYYPFGMIMPGRSGGEDYRYGFNGMEKDDEGTGNHYVTEFRHLDVRLGRWFSLDPVIHMTSMYVALDNNPILLQDPTGSNTIEKDWRIPEQPYDRELQQRAKYFIIDLWDAMGGAREWYRQLGEQDIWDIGQWATMSIPETIVGTCTTGT